MPELRIGSVMLPSNLLLAPIAGFCDLAFRLVVRRVPGVPRPPRNLEQDDRGAYPTLGMASTDLLCPEAVLRETDKTAWLAATHADDQPLCMQLYGRHPDTLREAGLWAQAHGATVIDVNMGCPVDKVTKKNGGSMLLTEPCLAVEIVEKLVKAVDVPVTAKIRLGWDERRLIVDTLPVALADVGVAAVTVHGRTTAMKFRGQCRRADIARVVEAVKRRHPGVAVIGNGDVKTPTDARTMLAETGCDGVMIGRGALGQPWLFRDAAYELTTGEPAPTYPRVERARCLVDHFENMVAMRDERYALHKVRQRASWYSPYLQPWPHLRRDIRELDSIAAVREFLHAGIERIAGEQEEAATCRDAA